MLADRVGIIDHGRIVAEGTPEALKAEIGQPERRGGPGRAARPRAHGGVLERFGDGDRRHHEADSRRRAPARRWRTRRGGAGARRREHRGRPPAAARAHPRRRLPGQDRRSLEGEAASETERRRAGAGAAAPRHAGPASTSRSAAGAALGHAHAAPARPMVVPVDLLPADPAGDQHRRAGHGHRDPRLPDRLLPDLRARGRRSSRPRIFSVSAAGTTWPTTSRPASSTGWRSRRCGGSP